MNAEQVKLKLIDIIGEASDSLVERVIEKLESDKPTGEICYSSSKLGNCYWSYTSLVFGDCIMPGGNGGPAGAKEDITDDLLGRVRTCSYKVDSGD